MSGRRIRTRIFSDSRPRAASTLRVRSRSFRPNQLYWTAQQLGRFAFSIPANLEGFKPLFSAIGVKNAPDAKDYVDLLLDVVGAVF
jgi:hypothetical protein